MTVSKEYKIFLEELFTGLGPVSIRTMFGGAGIYHDGVMFALAEKDTLYLKADESTRSIFEAEDVKPFTYMREDKPVTLSYWELPEALYDDPDKFTEWSRKALDAAQRAKRK